MSKTPSEWAMRAAEKIIDILAPGDHERNVRMAADLIDRETGLPELIAACEEMLEAHPKYPHRIGSEGSPARLIQERQDAAIDALRKALSTKGTA